jgi:predicted nucleic-acid-binding protein
MIGLDTNVLVRYFTQDDPTQSPRATNLIERRLNEANPGFVSIVAMVETVWVLERAYGLADEELAAIIERLLQAPVLVIENEIEVFTALTALKEGRGDFADALLGELGRRAGCSVTFTFDQRASRLPHFALA